MNFTALQLKLFPQGTPELMAVGPLFLWTVCSIWAPPMCAWCGSMVFQSSNGNYELWVLCHNNRIIQFLSFPAHIIILTWKKFPCICNTGNRRFIKNKGLEILLILLLQNTRYHFIFESIVIIVMVLRRKSLYSARAYLMERDSDMLELSFTEDCRL